ncbi:MAG: response regulator [Verrucomicrobiota bacterium]
MESETVIEATEPQILSRDSDPSPLNEATNAPGYSKERYVLGANTDWLDLVDHQTFMSGSTTMEAAQNFFRDHPNCRYSVVLDESGQIVGLCSEQKIGNTLSQWGLGYAVFARKAIRNHILENDFRIVRGTPVYKVLNAIMERKDDFFDDVILVDEHDRFQGLIRVATLVHLQHEINRQQYDEIKTFSSQLNRNNEELARSRDAAMQAADMKSSFLANMSHEIRTPLNGILGMIKILLRTPLNEKQRRYAQTVQHSGAALLTILNDILDFSKIEAGKMDLEEIPFDLNELMDETVQLMDERAREKGLELFSWVNSNVPAGLISDPARLRQVLLNLISNAIKFTEAGEVMIRVTQESDLGECSRIKISVTDTGIGISAENQAKLFQAFQQADSSTNRKFGGTGLGLAISRKIVELLGGHIALQSKEGQGSTFSFTVDFKKQKKEPSSPDSNPEPVDFWGVRALIVTENPSYAGFISEQITSWNILSKHISSANDAMSFALQTAQRGAPMDIIFLDSQMGDQTGFDFVAELRSHTPLEDSRVILLTGKNQELDPQRTRELRITDTLPKPLRVKNLQDSIALSLARQPKDSPPPHNEQNTSAESQSEAPTEGLVQDSAPESDIRPLKLLLVEDSEVNREVALIQLKTWQHQVQTAGNGKIAIELLSREQFDGVLMDCQMPEMDGYAAAAEIRNPDSAVIQHDLYIIAMTANALQGDRDKCLQAGMNDYVSKPVDETELLSALHRCAEHSPELLLKQEPQPAPPSAPPSTARASFPSHLIELFFRETEQRIEELQSHLETNSMEKASRAAHTIKGTAGNFAATQLADLAREMEAGCQDGNLQRAWELLPQIQHAFAAHRSLAATHK